VVHLMSKNVCQYNVYKLALNQPLIYGVVNIGVCCVAVSNSNMKVPYFL
jgi:hypothetical protein